MITISQPIIGDEEIQAVERVLRSGQIASGPTTAAFENEFAKFVKVPHAVAVSNGTVAIECALESFGIGPGDEVIVPAFTFIATANAVVRIGATPVFADINDENFTIDLESVKAAGTERTKAVIAVHLYGHPAAMHDLEILCQANGWFLIGDAAQAHGARLGSRSIGSFGDAETWSFYPTKNLSCPEGGMITTNNPNIAAICRSIANHGREGSTHGTYEHVRAGGNLRLSDVHSAIGRVQLKNLHERLQIRAQNAKYYTENLQGIEGITTPKVSSAAVHAWHQFTLLVEERESFISHMKKNGVGTGIYYPKPLHHYPHLALAHHDSLAQSEQASETAVSIPVHPNLSKSDLDTVVQTIHSWRPI